MILRSVFGMFLQFADFFGHGWAPPDCAVKNEPKDTRIAAAGLAELRGKLVVAARNPVQSR
jgi:hypothetical protein